MKRFIALLMTVILAFSLCACGAKNTENEIGTNAQDSYEQNIRKEMKSYAGKWVGGTEDRLEEDTYIYLFEDGVYMIFYSHAADYLFDKFDLNDHGNQGTWDIRNDVMYFYSVSEGGATDVIGFEIIDENTLDAGSSSGTILIRRTEQF